MSNKIYGFKSLTDDQCLTIYNRVVIEKLSRKVVGDDFGVSDRTVGRVVAAVRDSNLSAPTTSGDVATSHGDAKLATDSIIDDSTTKDDVREEPATTPVVDCAVKDVPARVNPKLALIDSADESEFYATTDGLTLNITFRGDIKTITRKQTNFDAVLSKIVNEGKKAAYKLLSDAGEAINQCFGNNPNVEYRNGKVYYHGIELNFDTVLAAINRFAGNGEDKQVKRLLNFLDKLAQNPSKSAIEGLYRFIVHNNIELDDDGNLIAFKKVRSDYKDIHSGTYDNSVGNTIKMDRRAVTEDANQTCSSGLHACSWAYLNDSGFGNSNSRYLKVRISPRDVVSVPSDYNGTKMRCCEYTVISLIG